jgi:Ankyrin repeats (3 copies)
VPSAKATYQPFIALPSSTAGCWTPTSAPARFCSHCVTAVANVFAHLGVKLNILEASALGNEKRVLEWLSFHSAITHQRDTHGWTALHHASEHGHLNIVKALLEAGADANAVIANTTTRAIDLTSNPKIQIKLKNAANRTKLAPTTTRATTRDRAPLAA